MIQGKLHRSYVRGWGGGLSFYTNCWRQSLSENSCFAWWPFLTFRYAIGLRQSQALLLLLYSTQISYHVPPDSDVFGLCLWLCRLVVVHLKNNLFQQLRISLLIYTYIICHFGPRPITIIERIEALLSSLNTKIYIFKLVSLFYLTWPLSIICQDPGVQDY